MPETDILLKWKFEKPARGNGACTVSGVILTAQTAPTSEHANPNGTVFSQKIGIDSWWDGRAIADGEGNRLILAGRPSARGALEAFHKFCEIRSGSVLPPYRQNPADETLLSAPEFDIVLDDWEPRVVNSQLRILGRFAAPARPGDKFLRQEENFRIFRPKWRDGLCLIDGNGLHAFLGQPHMPFPKDFGGGNPQRARQYLLGGESTLPPHPYGAQSHIRLLAPPAPDSRAPDGPA